MISIEKNSGRKYIAGIFKTNKKALKFFSVISNKEEFNIVEYVDFSFPFFIIENNNDFIYFKDKDAVITWFNVNEIDNDNEDCTLYFIEKEFVPKMFGEDYMGALDHIHMDKDNVKNIEEIVS